MKYLFLILLLCSCHQEDNLVSRFPAVVEEREIIAVIDTGIEPNTLNEYLCQDYLHKSFIGKSIRDNNGHGTNVAGLISKTMNPKKQCLMIIKAFDKLASVFTAYTDGIKWAVDHNAKFINFSAGGGGKINAEYQQILRAINNKIHFSCAAGNENKDITNGGYYPAAYDIDSPYFHVVGSFENDGGKSYYSNYGTPVKTWEHGTNQCFKNICMTGTSQACANYTGYIIQFSK